MIRVFGSSSCDYCKKLIKQLSQAKLTYMYVDANAEKNQALCDRHDVDSLPHIQVLGQNREVAFEYKGIIDIDVLKVAVAKTQRKTG